MARIRLCIGLVALLAWPAASQELLRIELQLRESVPIEGQLSASFIVEVPLKCDERGNVYLRWYQKEYLHGSPIAKISSDGKKTAVISIQSAPGFEEGAAYNFAVSPQGEVYLLGAKSVAERHVVKFNNEGKFDSVFLLEPFLEPYHIAIFASGELLVSGQELSPLDGKPTGRLLLAVYDRSGKFLREVSLPRDIALPAEQASGKVAEDAEAAFSLGNLHAADDGNIYLMRATENPIVYAIAPGGTVLRRLVIEPPAEGFRVSTLKVAGGRIAIQFRKQKSSDLRETDVFTVIDAQTGEKWALYVSSPGVGGAWACYTPESFTFLGSVGKPPRMSLLRASP